MLTGIHEALLIRNPTAGPSRRFGLQGRGRELEEARRILAEAGIRTELAETAGAGDATRLARQAAKDGRELVIACGGDGTINEVVNGLAGSAVPLAILPAGTANVFAKELALPGSLPAAARLIPSSRLERIALGLALPGAGASRPEVSGFGTAPEAPEEGAGRYFLSIAGAGVDGSMVYRVNSRLKRATGTLAYWFQGLTHFFHYDLATFAVEAGEQSFQAAQVIVGRTKSYGGPFQLTPGADLFSNRFEVAVFTTRNRFRYPSHMMAVWLSRLEEQGDVHLVKTESVRCAAEPDSRIYFEIDGEAAGTLPVEFRIVPGALTLVVPENVTREAGSSVHPS